MENSKILIENVRGKLTVEDDLALWEEALRVLVQQFLLRYDREAKNREWVFLVGACSHWVRPHNSLWNAAGGFAYPEGYQNSLPELDWSAIFSCKDRGWSLVPKLQGKNNVVFRVAVPARTARHKQAAVHTKWSTIQDPIFYGFRNLEGSWKCIAASDEEDQSSDREIFHQ
jgi:hypothetical protein